MLLLYDDRMTLAPAVSPHAPGTPTFTRALVAAERCARNGMPLTGETLASEDPGLAIFDATELLADERFAAALEELGINHTPTQRISSEQLAAAQIYLASPPNSSHAMRLRAIGISQAKWSGWMRQPEFRRYIADGSADILHGSLPAAHLAVADAAGRGQPWAVNLVYQVTGFHDPNKSIDLNAVLSAVFEILSDEGVDYEVLSRAAQRVREIDPAASAGATPPRAMLTMTPAQERAS